MTLDSFRNYCLAKPAVTEEMPFGPDTLVFKIVGKMFALTSLDTERFSINLKCDPERAIELRASNACVLPGYHMNKAHWNTILIDRSVSNAQLQEWIDDSYNLVLTSLTRKKQMELRASNFSSDL
ncbi:MAG: MmcQ/YjbR family DNA-binding protein [Cytophagaceae bacterium]|nr:MmcQ/YjbR family DNA-binding protein [Cytophagaceae bacterium]